MMCRVVADPLLPLHNFAPLEPLSADEPTHNVQDILPNILKAPQVYENRRDFVESVQDGAVRAGLATLFNIDFASRSAEGISLQSEKLKRYTLNNPEQTFNELMINEDYARDVQGLLRKFGRAYLVVGFLTTSGTIWAQSQTRGSTFGFNVTLPISETLGAPAPVDPNVDTSVSGASRRGLHMHVVKEEIFAVAYDVVKTSYTVDRRNRRVKKAPVIGRALQARTRLRFGDDSDSSDSSDEDDIAFVNGDDDSSEEEHDHSRCFDFAAAD
jgi:hypothetical protein